MRRSCEIYLQPYKGYSITKIYDIINGSKTNIQYLVCDDEWIIDVFLTLKGAKKYIDNVLVEKE